MKRHPMKIQLRYFFEKEAKKSPDALSLQPIVTIDDRGDAVGYTS